MAAIDAKNGKLRVIVDLTSTEAINGMKNDPDIGEFKILPSDLCFTNEGDIIFGNEITPFKSGDVLRFYGFINSNTLTILNEIKDKNALPVYDYDTNSFLYQFKQENGTFIYYKKNPLYDNFYNNKFSNELNSDRLYLYKNKIYIYNENPTIPNQNLELFTSKPKVENETLILF